MAKRLLVAGCVAVTLVVLVACAGRSGLSITVVPSEVTLAPGESQVFTATVMGAANKGVSWSLSGQTVDGLVPSGMTAVFTAPLDVGEYTVTARSAADQGRWASALVVVEESDAGGTYGYGDPVPLGGARTQLLGDGVEVTVPAVAPGATASVAFALADSPVGVEMPLAGLSQVVALRLEGELSLCRGRGGRGAAAAGLGRAER